MPVLAYFISDHWTARFLVRPIIIGYALLFCVALFFSDSFIFCPRPSSYQDSAEIVKLTTADGVRISARYYPVPESRYTVLYSHGNGEDMGEGTKLYTLLNDLGISVFAYDYHGYGTSGGQPTEAHTYQDINTAYAYLTQTLRIPADRIIVYGRSLGGGPSVDLAAREPVAGLVVQSSFVSAFRVATQKTVLPFDKFASLKKIGHVRCPVLIVHGTDDRNIPIWHGKQLYAAARAPKMHLWVDEADHNNLFSVAEEELPATLSQFVDLIGQQRPVPSLP